MFWIASIVGIVASVYLLALCLTAAARRADRKRDELLRRLGVRS